MRAKQKSEGEFFRGGDWEIYLVFFEVYTPTTDEIKNNWGGDDRISGGMLTQCKTSDSH